MAEATEETSRGIESRTSSTLVTEVMLDGSVSRDLGSGPREEVAVGRQASCAVGSLESTVVARSRSDSTTAETAPSGSAAGGGGEVSGVADVHTSEDSGLARSEAEVMRRRAKPRASSVANFCDANDAHPILPTVQHSDDRRYTHTSVFHNVESASHS